MFSQHSQLAHLGGPRLQDFGPEGGEQPGPVESQ